MNIDQQVLDHLRSDSTIGLRELGKAVGHSRNAAHRAVRALVQSGALVVEELGTCAEKPTTYRVVGQ